MENKVPTYVYEYATAVEQDRYLVPYYNIEVKTEFLDEGITYDELSDADKTRYDDDWEEAVGANAPDFTPASKLFKWVYNEETVDIVLQDLMENGIKVKGGERIGKTIIFAASKDHATFIVEHEAAMEAFAEFINDTSLNQQQIAFVHRVVDYVETNGYMEASALLKPPFDRPASFIKLFDDAHQKRLIELINQVKDNAIKPAA